MIFEFKYLDRMSFHSFSSHQSVMNLSLFPLCVNSLAGNVLNDATENHIL